jgi:prophage maintenance system killer protein
MITLEVADLVVIASRTLGLDTGQVLGLLDATAAESALAQARLGRDPGDPAGRAAALLDALVRGQPLRRGNQQVALAATLQFLALNGQEMDPTRQGRSRPWSRGLPPARSMSRPSPSGWHPGCGPPASQLPV